MPRPRAEWLERDAPTRRIVEQATWDAVHRARRAGPPKMGRPGKTLFGGLLKCPCGAAIVVTSATRYGCVAHRDRGDTMCAIAASFRRDAVDEALVADLRETLLEPSAIAELRDAVRAALREQQADAPAPTGKRRRELEAEIARVVDAIAAVGHSAALVARLKAAEAERDALDAAARRPAVATLLPDVVKRFEAIVARLREALEDEADRERTREILAELLGRVRLVREPEGDFAELEDPAVRLLVAAGGKSETMVAGARFELATFGL